MQADLFTRIKCLLLIGRVLRVYLLATLYEQELHICGHLHMISVDVVKGQLLTTKLHDIM